MISLYTEEEFNLAKSNDLLPCKCVTCGKIFYKRKTNIKKALANYINNTGNFCSQKCNQCNKDKKTSIIVKCTNCGKEFEKQQSQINKVKNHFCSCSCSVTYNNTHKTKGNRRSKLEVYLENELVKLYPNLEMHFNCKDTINSELDIYVPSLKLGFELNGIFHYEPIFGETKHNQIQNNDNRKFQACLEKNIELCIINISEQKHFSIKSSEIYLNIINNLIKSKL